VDADARPERAPSQALGTKRLRLRLFTLPATIARTSRQVRLHLATKAPWADLVNESVARLRALAIPG
jgi:Transposase DDE domain group 1